jgi:hypothetical protein
VIRCVTISYKSRSGLPSRPVKRSLTLIAKVIQSLANLNTVSQVKIFVGACGLIHRDRASRKKPSCVVFKTF